MNARPFFVPGSVLLVCLWSSCGGSGPAEALADGSSSDEPWRGVEAVDMGLSVRPDVLRLPFAFWQETDTLESALPTLKAAVDAYAKEVGESVKGKVPVKMTYLEMRDPNEAFAQGTLEVALPASLDLWGRTALVAGLKRVGAQQADRLEKMNSGARAAFGAPLAQVRDLEAHRAELVKRWVERARSFMSQAQSAQAPLQIVDCTPPAEITQQSVSVDEMVLSLAVSCRLDVVAK